MKVLIVQPDIARSPSDRAEMYPSIGPNLLATMIRRRGHSAKVIDPLVLAAAGRWGLPGLLREAEDWLLSHPTDLVGISTVLQTRAYAWKLAQLVKRLSPETKVVVGGAAAALLGPQLLRRYGKWIDYIVYGEGEEALGELIGCIERGALPVGVRGVGYQDGASSDGVRINPPRPPIENLDLVPFPDYADYLSMTPEGRLDAACLLLSRGCPYSCTFCGTHAMWGGVRYRSPANVFAEITELHRRYGTTQLRINDDAFGANKGQASAVLRLIADSGMRLRLYAHARFDSVTADFLRQYRDAGGESIYYGLESGSPRLRRRMGKYVSDADILRVSSLTKGLGIKLGLFLMLGYPTETFEDVRRTFALLEAIQPDDVACSVVKIQPGTTLYRTAAAEGLITDDQWIEEDREYFTFLTSANEAIIQGCQSILYERFSHRNLRALTEKNNDLREISGDSRRLAEARSKALAMLACGS